MGGMDNPSINKVAIITGAGSGIGLEVARQLACEDSFAVVLVGRTGAKLNATRDAIVARSVDTDLILTITGDITEPSFCRSVIAQTIATFGRLDALANIAGAAPLQPIEETTDAIWRNVIDTNLTSVVHLTAAAWPHLKAQSVADGSVIANVSSLASIDPFPGFALYASAKVGVNMFTLCTGREGVEHNIRAVCIAPGAVETPMLRGLFDESMITQDQTLPPESVAEIIADCITGRHDFEPGETIPLPSPE